MSFGSLEKELESLLGEESSSVVIRLSSKVPDRELFLLNFIKISESYGAEEIRGLTGEEKFMRLLTPVLSASEFLTGIIVANPTLLTWLFSDGNYRRALDPDELKEEVVDLSGQISHEEEMARILRKIRNREILRIGLRDLGKLAGMEETSAALSDLAEAALAGATAFSLSHWKAKLGVPLLCDVGGSERECGFCVIALGKFGGRELNFSSDIDIMYVYESDRPALGEDEGILPGTSASLHQHFIKVSEMVTRLIGDVTEDGAVFRVDLRLRPDGTRGPLANSIRALETYYESWGHTWERAALIKARPVAGDLSLGERIIKSLTPFVYRKYLDYVSVEEVKKLKERIDISLKVRRDELWDVKLGEGGIREIEFFIQSHQLIFGGKTPSIRIGNSLRALASLRQQGYVSPSEEEALAGSYRFLRDLEHRIQMLRGRQTQQLPQGEDLGRVAFTMGFHGPDLFMKELEKRKKVVRETFRKLFAREKEEIEEDIPPEIISVLYGEVGEGEVMEVLSGLGFSEPEKAARDVELLRSGPEHSRLTESGRGYLRKIAPLIFWKVAQTPDPDMALSNTERFITSIGAKTTLYALLSENPGVIDPLIQLFGSSQYLTGYFLNHPELMDMLLRRGQSAITKSKTEMRKELGEMLVAAEGLEEELDVMRRFRNEEFLRIGIHKLGDNLSLEEFSFQLSALAEVTMGYALFFAFREVKEKFGRPLFTDEMGEKKESTIVVIGMGKLGGEELNFHSDLDIIFIYSHMGETEGGITNHEFFAKVAQRFISNLSTATKEGYVYKVDMRLRPSGSAGPLVTSQEAFKKYYMEQAKVWERQALIKSRFVAGDREFGKGLENWVRWFVFDRPIEEDLSGEISKVRKRMENELAKEKDGFHNIKFGRGGLIDVEFLVQYLQLVNGGKAPPLKTQNTLKALYELHLMGALNEGEFRDLDRGYRFLRDLEIGLRLVHDASVERFMIDDRGIKFLNIPTLEDFESEYSSVTGKIRDIYSGFLGA